jgi:hypothetical protein
MSARRTGSTLADLASRAAFMDVVVAKESTERSRAANASVETVRVVGFVPTELISC